jgi:hypothetical protein
MCASQCLIDCLTGSAQGSLLAAQQKGIEIRTQLWRRAYLPTWTAGLSICLLAGLGVVAVFRSIPASYGSIPDDVPSTLGLAPSGSAEARADDPQAKGEVARDTINRRNRTRCLKCGVVESMRQIDLSAEVAGQDTVDVKAAQGVSGGVSGGTVAARAPAGKLYEITVRLRDGSTTVLKEASPRTWRLGNRVIVIGRPNAENTN